MLATLPMLLLLSAPIAPAPAEQAAEARELYRRAATRLGTALGERGDARDPALAALRSDLADIQCLLLDVEGCLENSRLSGRAPGSYVPPLGGSSLARDQLARFLEELASLRDSSSGDRSLAYEVMALLDRDAADSLRAAAQATVAPQLAGLLDRAQRSPDPPLELLAAFRLARMSLDPDSAAKIVLRLGEALQRARGAGSRSAATPEELAEALRDGADMLRIAGREQDALGVERWIQELATKALTPPELSFELAPSPQDFTADLARAREQGLALARLAPLRSRASLVLHFAAAFAGVIAGDSEAPDELSDILEAARLSDPYLGARITVLMGYGAFQQGDFERAAQLLGRAEDDPALPSVVAARAQAARAQALHYLGDYGAAAEAFARAARALPHGSGARLRALAGCSHALAFAGRAKEAVEQHAVIASELPAAPEAERGELARMLELERALSLLLAGRGPEAERTLLDLAGAALAAGDLATGTIARINLAEWLNDTGRPGPALEQATGALAFIDVGRQPDAGWQALTEKGRALAALGDPRAAQAAFAAAMDLVERLRARIGAEGARRSFLAAKTRLYQAAVALSASGGRPEAAFEISERARARAFLDQIGERRLRLARPEDQHRFEEARRLRLRALPPALLSVESAFALAPAPVLAGGLDPDPRKGWLSLAQVNPARLFDVQKALHANEMLLSYFHDGQRLHLFAVGRRSLSAAAVEIPAPELEGRVAGLLRSLQQPQRGTELLREKARELHRLLIEPLDASLAKTTRLTIVPWGPLHRLPMGTLWDGKRYLAEQFEISLAPSASTLVLIRSRPASAGGEVLALGNPRTDLPDLPAAQEEARQVARNFPGAVVRLGEQATKQALVEHSGSARLLHLSAHGVFVPKRPLDSYLALAGATPETGRLKGIDVLGLDLARQPLVVLSACASGQAESQGAEEWLGLSRAFLQAGASALLASLWNVADDGTAELFSAFYRTLKSGRAPASALAAAARTLIRSREFSHPFYWAAFQAIGG